MLRSVLFPLFAPFVRCLAADDLPWIRYNEFGHRELDWLSHSFRAPGTSLQVILFLPDPSFLGFAHLCRPLVDRYRSPYGKALCVG